MKEKGSQIQWKIIQVVNRILFFIVPSVLISGCASLSTKPIQLEEDIYAILEKENFTSNSLLYKTIPYEELIAGESFTYKNINENNYHTSILVEDERYIDFDTVFGPEKRKEITEHFQGLREVELKKSLMKHPETLSKVTQTVIGEPSKSRGTNRVTYPFIVEGDKGELYGFIYRYPVGNIYIYRKKHRGWEKIAVVHISV